jgi:hypothetical protein
MIITENGITTEYRSEEMSERRVLALVGELRAIQTREDAWNFAQSLLEELDREFIYPIWSESENGDEEQS